MALLGIITLFANFNFVEEAEAADATKEIGSGDKPSEAPAKPADTKTTPDWVVFLIVLSCILSLLLIGYECI